MEDRAKKIKELLYSNPNLLLSLPLGEAVGRKCLPFSLGFEFECHQGENYDLGVFKSIPNIMAVSVGGTEQRYRIPSGLKGLICLFDIANNMKIYSLLNEQSGIHIHVNFTDCDKPVTDSFLEEISPWLLSELDQYDEHPDGYNKRKIGRTKCNWVKACTGYGTWEFRVFRQTFEYSRLLDYAIHLSELAVEIKTRLGMEFFAERDPEITKLQKLLKNLKNEELEKYDQPSSSLHKIKEVTKKRLIKWNC